MSLQPSRNPGTIVGAVAAILLGAALFTGCAAQDPAAARTSGQGVGAEPAELTYPDSAREGLGEIVYVGTDGNVMTVDRDGSDVTPVTTGAGDRAYRFSLATWSPDGRKIAFMGHDRAGAEQPVRNVLYVADTTAGRIRPIHTTTEGAPFYMDWRPDSRTVSFLSSVGETSRLSLQLVDIDGTNHRVLAQGRPLYYDWSPSGNAIVTHIGGSAVRRQGATGTIGLLDVQNGEVSNRELGHPPTFFQAPAFSPDGARIAAAALSPRDANSILILGREGGLVRTLTDVGGFAAFDWSPAGNRLAYVDGTNSPYAGVVGDLYVADLRAVPNVVSYQSGASSRYAQNVIAFFWSPDGEKIAYFQPVSTQQQGEARFRYLRLVILFLESNEKLKVGVFPPTLSFLTSVIPYYDQYQRSRQIWSPDSSHVVINSQTTAQKPGVYVIPVRDVNSTRLVAEGDMPFWRPEPTQSR